MNKNNAHEEIRPTPNTRASRVTAVATVVVSVLVAFVIWIYAIGYDSNFERTFNGIEVTVEGEAQLLEQKGYTLISEYERFTISVGARGNRSRLNELTAEDFTAVIDVSQAQSAGDQTLKIIVYSPNGIEIISQSSTTAHVFIDEYTQRSELLSVSVETGDSYIMSEGVTSVTATANPLSVLVSGPASVLDTVKGAYVKYKLDGVKISDNIYGSGTIELRDALGNVIDNPYIVISETKAYVTVNVTKRKEIPVRVQFTGGMFDPKDVTVGLSSATVIVEGSPEAVNSLGELVLNIDETTIDGTGTFEFAVGSMLPAGVSNGSGFSKVTVTVTMPKMAVRGYRIKASSISVINLADGYTYKIKNDLNISLIGPRDAFAAVDRGAITATVDFDRVTIEPDGSYTAVAVIELGGEYEGIYILNENYTVNFTVEEE